ncbi:MAG: hypothetical protein IPM82_22350 [Saprospiraceae bacterium]|nr:hypothetical protein [Saprospiraceae bacterium]
MEKQAENTTSPVLKSETGEVYDIPEGGSLGLLALGYAGLMLWRGKRRTTTGKAQKTTPTPFPTT